jgi:hypothetical protein
LELGDARIAQDVKFRLSFHLFRDDTGAKLAAHSNDRPSSSLRAFIGFDTADNAHIQLNQVGLHIAQRPKPSKSMHRSYQ